MTRTCQLIVVFLLASSASALPVNVESPTLSAVGPLCKDCEGIITQIQTAVKSANDTYAQIAIQYLEKNVCANLPDSAAASCKAAVEEEIPDIWDQIINDYLDPKITCTKLGLCKESTEISSATPAPDPQCKLCKKATAWVDANVFEDPDTEAKVAAELKNLCLKIADKGKPVEAKCEELVTEDTPDLMQTIGKAVAAELCVDIGACTKA